MRTVSLIFGITLIAMPVSMSAQSNPLQPLIDALGEIARQKQAEADARANDSEDDDDEDRSYTQRSAPLPPPVFPVVTTRPVGRAEPITAGSRSAQQTQSAPTPSAADRANWSRSQEARTWDDARDGILADVAACKQIARDGIDAVSCDRKGNQIFDSKQSLRYATPSTMPPAPNFGRQPMPVSESNQARPATNGASVAENPRLVGEPIDQYGKRCGSYTRLADYRTGIGDVMRAYSVTNGCSSAIKFRYRFDNMSSPGRELIPAGGTKRVSCIDVPNNPRLRCSGELLDARFEP